MCMRYYRMSVSVSPVRNDTPIDNSNFRNEVLFVSVLIFDNNI